MKNRSPSLYLGLSFLVILVVIAAVGPAFAPFGLNDSENLRTVMVDGEKQYIYAPEPPNPHHPLGSDVFGYDLLTMLLYGAKYTLLACLGVAVMRVALGIVIGVAAGFRGPPQGRVESLGGLPAFIIVFFILGGITINSNIPLARLFFFQVTVIALVGLPGVISPFQARTYGLVNQTFVEAARSSGAGPVRIVIKHLMPHLRGDILILLMTELTSALTMIGQLGIFSLFLGGTIFTASPPLLHSVSKEWAGLIGQARGRIMTAPWLLFVPLAAYFFVFLTFHLITGGLETLYRRRYEKAPYV